MRVAGCKLQVTSCRLQVAGKGGAASLRVQGVRKNVASYRIQVAGEYIIHPKCLFCIFIETFNHEKLPRSADICRIKTIGN